MINIHKICTSCSWRNTNSISPAYRDSL